MTEKPLVSIIMPSLNVAAYIRECMDSVIGQTLRDIEIICVDAGSDDGTFEILKEYQEKDERIRIISSDKKSYGYQMNLGVSAAAGEYIGIIETDDWAEPEMFEMLYQTAIENDADFVKSNYYWYYTKTEVVNQECENLQRGPYREVFCPIDHLYVFGLTPSIWSGLYKKDLLIENNIRFNETPGASFQDASFHLMVCTASKRAYFIDEYLLHYRRDNESSSVSVEGKVYCVCDEMHYYEQYLSERLEDRAIILGAYLEHKFKRYEWNYLRLAPEFQWPFLMTMHREFAAHQERGELIPKAYESDYNLKKTMDVIEDPIRYFQNTCKKYSTRQTPDDLHIANQVLKQCAVKDPDISVVIPACNNEEILDNSINSILNQTHQNIELICVDDSSTDQTQQKMLQYAAKDERITVIRQTFHGLSGARNTGLAEARGKYVCFLDADDALRKDALKYLLQKEQELSTDLIWFDGKPDYADDYLRSRHFYDPEDFIYANEVKRPVNGKKLMCHAVREGAFRENPCRGFYDREFLKKNNLCFMEESIYEDYTFLLRCFLAAGKAWHTTEAFYTKSVRYGSVTTQAKNWRHVYGILKCIEKVDTIMNEPGHNRKLRHGLETEQTRLKAILEKAYHDYPNKQACRDRLAIGELKLLDAALQIKHK